MKQGNIMEPNGKNVAEPQGGLGWVLGIEIFENPGRNLSCIYCSLYSYVFSFYAVWYPLPPGLQNHMFQLILLICHTIKMPEEEL